MSDAFWDYFFKMLTPVLVAIVAGWFGRRLNVQDKKLETIETLSNSMLSQTKAEKDAAETKLELAKDTELATAKAKNIEYEKQIALMTNPKKDG